MNRADLFDLRDDLYRRPLQTALTRVEVQEGWKIVDVGAGNGDVSVALAQLVGESGRIYSVDIDPRRRNEVASRAAMHAQVIALTQAVEDLALPELVDLAFCRFLLLGVHDPSRALVKMVSQVRPGGWVVIQEPVTSAGRIDDESLRSDSPMIEHPDVGMKVPKLLDGMGIPVVDSWAEAPVGLGGSEVGDYLEELTGCEVDAEVVMLPPLITVVARIPAP